MQQTPTLRASLQPPGGTASHPDQSASLLESILPLNSCSDKMSPFCLNERKPGIFLFNASKRCLHTCTIAIIPPCSCASRLSPPNVLDSTKSLRRHDSPCRKLDLKKHWSTLSRKCWWVSKAALVEPEEEATEQGLQGYTQVLSTLGGTGPHFCKWWSLNSRKTVVFLQSIPLSTSGTQQWGSGI